MSVCSRLAGLAAVLLPALLSGAAAAQSLAYSAPGATNMRAGPGFDYPVIAQVVGGSRVDVYGCVQDYSWCDSTVQGYRGWISTTRLEFPYAGRRVAVPQYHRVFRAPIIGFDFGYWDRYYSDRPFYRDRGRWDRHWRHGDGRRYDEPSYGGDEPRRRRSRDRDRDDDYVVRGDDNNQGRGRVWRRRGGDQGVINNEPPAGPSGRLPRGCAQTDNGLVCP